MTLEQGQFDLVYSAFSLAIAAMGASFVFFLLQRTTLRPGFRLPITVSAVVVLIALYHYVRIFDSWNAAFLFDPASRTYTSGVEGTLPFSEGYRYVDWLLTVPLLLAELVLVMRLAAGPTRSLIVRLGIAAAAMILLGYPGETSAAGAPFSFDARGVWGLLSTIPFAYILFVLYTELGRAIGRQPVEVRGILRGVRILLVASWGFYPIAYIVPSFLPNDPALGEVIRQVGYSLADIIAKPGFGLVILAIATIKARLDEAGDQPASVPAGRAA
jgi:bacteriorhodopsin